MAVSTVEIPRDTWQPFFNDLGRAYRGWATTIEVVGGGYGAHPRVDGVPLQGMSYEYKGGSQAGDVLIEAGDAGTPYEVHRVPKPRAVRAAPTQPGGETDVEIESDEGFIHIVRIRARPELPSA